MTAPKIKARRGRPRATGIGKRRNEFFARSGRRSKWRDEYIEIGRKLAAEGKTDGEIADILDVGPSTISYWKVVVPAFARALKRGEENDIKAIEHAMKQRAMGYSHKTEKIFMYKGKAVRAPIEERFAPDVNAAKLILAAKKPEEYGERLELSGNGARPVKFELVGLYDKDHPPPKDD
jgi:hypothetical protein